MYVERGFSWVVVVVVAVVWGGFGGWRGMENSIFVERGVMWDTRGV